LTRISTFARKLFRCGLILSAALVFLSAQSVAADDEPATRLVARGNTVGRAVLELQAAPLVSMTPTPFRLTLLDPRGVEIRQAKVNCELTMPAMPMPENRVEARWDGEVYRGEAVFTMAGKWRAACRVVPLSGGLPETLHFDIDEVLLK